MKMRWIAMAAPLLFFGTSAYAGGDVEAGKAAFESNDCAGCHYAEDFAGMEKGAIKDLIKSKTDHDPDLTALSDEDVANIAAYLASVEG